ncbi:MAG: hypothetical protein IT428_21935 [Planctomycetaceae bacterium]|nr:hypothetical protein [Planctomycetaceae bacterium]
MTRAAEPADSIKAILSVNHDGKGAAEAQQAVKALSTADASQIPAVLAAFKGANPLAANYLRGVVETIADRTLRSGGNLPTAELKKFIDDRGNDAKARSLAFDWLKQADKPLAESLIPAMITDPSPDLRREAVARLIKIGADAKEKADAVKAYEEAMAGAVDEDQVKDLVEKLKKHGKTIDLQKHFGFLTKWHIAGPFDNKGLKGFATEYPPEKGVDLKARYEGQLGEVTWTEISTKEDYGILDIAKEVKPYKGAVMYLTTDFTSDSKRLVELRLGTPNAWKVWVNGKELFAREEYHRGMAVDQYRVPAELKAGKNTILVKLCQNEQEQDWAQRYQLQLRVCDPSGTAVPSNDAVAAK